MAESYVCIFESVRPGGDPAYEIVAEAMVRLAGTQPGFVRVESLRDASGKGITLSYWDSLEAIRAWKAVLAHREAQQLGQAKWYQSYRVTVAQVVRDYAWGNAAEGFVPGDT